MTDREYDLVLFGATGFTGGLTARYLAGAMPAGGNWALAGRDLTKLEAVRAELAVIDPRWTQLPLLIADVTEPASLQAVAAASRVVISTVGPYLRHGEPLVAACAAAGTDYLDLTGETEFVDLMYTRYHHRARQSGARLVHSCGFDSIPHDLGAYYTVGQLPTGVPIRMDGVVRAGGGLSGGTLQSVTIALSRLGSSLGAAKARRRVEERPSGRRVSTPQGLPRRADELWLLPLPTIDAQVVASSARALARYGPDFSYHHYAGVRRLPVALGGVAAVAGLAAIVQLPPARKLLLSRIRAGAGPSEERRAKGWFSVRFTATGGGRRVVTEVSGGDPGYGETAKMLGEAGLCLAFDELPESSGQLTTAVAMGQPLIDRLVAAGIEFRVVESG
ncbi:MAG: saccharopine dehydrogenase NADP-binding domain-containing protein [Actinomycetota bacterium]|nr:saccharopine dehydrogenase NADP-binding domain-containing protein [Actinomycetota bacterium]MDQ2958300.1 saccharopine dehydrogenase NADP-binding domain-containing protein [Actinomycetota bacterium]